MSTKRLEREGKTLGPHKTKAAEEGKNADLDEGYGDEKKRVSKYEVLKGHKDKFYENLKQVFKENAKAPVLEAPAPKKRNDIIKRNLAQLKKDSDKLKATKRSGSTAKAPEPAPRSRAGSQNKDIDAAKPSGKPATAGQSKR